MRFSFYLFEVFCFWVTGVGTLGDYVVKNKRTLAGIRTRNFQLSYWRFIHFYHEGFCKPCFYGREVCFSAYVSILITKGFNKDINKTCAFQHIKLFL